MNTRRANVLRSILSMAALGGGMPIGLGIRVDPPAPKPFAEARALAIELGVTYDEAEMAFLRFGEERARELIGICLRHNQRISHEVVDFIDRNSPHKCDTLLELNAAFQKAKADPASLLRPAIPEARQLRRSLAERKARRAKRKQRRQR